MALRAVGYFSNGGGGRLPDVRSQIDSFWEPQRKPRILIYLRNGAVFENRPGTTRCLLCPSDLPQRDLTDGVWLWPEGLAHYVEKHNVRVPDGMVAQMDALQFRVPKVDMRMLKLAATGLMDSGPVMNALDEVMTTKEKPPKKPPPQEEEIVTGDLDDSTMAIDTQQAWMASVIGVATPTPMTLVDKPMMIGREKKTAQIVIAHGAVSRRHARLIPTKTGVIVQDLGSQNGVFVNGKRISSQFELRDGQTFQVGPATITIKRAK
jgi:hypothetical protein